MKAKTRNEVLRSVRFWFKDQHIPFIDAYARTILEELPDTENFRGSRIDVAIALCAICMEYELMRMMREPWFNEPLVQGFYEQLYTVSINRFDERTEKKLAFTSDGEDWVITYKETGRIVGRLSYWACLPGICFVPENTEAFDADAIQEIAITLARLNAKVKR